MKFREFYSFVFVSHLKSIISYLSRSAGLRYDLTNTYFSQRDGFTEGRKLSSEKAKFGRSKEKRPTIVMDAGISTEENLYFDSAQYD